MKDTSCLLFWVVCGRIFAPRHNGDLTRKLLVSQTTCPTVRSFSMIVMFRMGRVLHNQYLKVILKQGLQTILTRKLRSWPSLKKIIELKVLSNGLREHTH